MKPSTRQHYVKSHRLLGSWATLVIVWVVVSGWILNHNERFGLEQVQISSAIVLKWYGMEPEGDIHAFAVADKWLTELDHTVFLEGTELTSLESPLLGAVQLDGMIAFGSEQELILGAQNQDFEIVDRFRQESLPGNILKIGLDSKDSLLIETDSGIYAIDENFIHWNKTETVNPSDINWSAAQEVPETLRQAVLENYRGEGVSLSRLLTDLHTGRLFGGFGFLLTDLAALVILILTLTGFINGITRRK